MNILGYKYDVTLQEGRFVGGDGYGKASVGLGEIIIANDLTPDQQVSTLLHEFFEVVNEQFRMGLQEEGIRVLEVATFNLLKTNGVDLPIFFNACVEKPKRRGKLTS